jgi:hypothetical protein
MASTVVTETHNLLAVHPGLAHEWHPSRNGTLTPSDVAPMSEWKAWWVCGKGHEWQAMICNRARGAGCPYCAGTKPAPDRCLGTINPALASQWHPSMNGSLTPDRVTPMSGRKVWWICEKKHEWQATIANRNRGNGCPYCIRKRVAPDTCLAAVNPELAREWHPTLNMPLTPQDVRPFSNKQVFWLCDKGHAWQAPIHSRGYGMRCPHCKTPGNMRRTTPRPGKSLEDISPALTLQWHPTKNGSVTPGDIGRWSTKKIWWVCPNGHEWKAAPQGRNSDRCPHCPRKRNRKQPERTCK